MSTNSMRSAELLAAESERARAIRMPLVAYSETVARLRQQYEDAMASALAELRAALYPAQHEYNAAVIAAEHLGGGGWQPARGVRDVRRPSTGRVC